MAAAAIFYVKYYPEKHHNSKAQEEYKIFQTEQTLCEEQKTSLHREPCNNRIHFGIALYPLSCRQLIESQETFHNYLTDNRCDDRITLHRAEQHTNGNAYKSPQEEAGIAAYQ